MCKARFTASLAELLAEVLAEMLAELLAELLAEDAFAFIRSEYYVLVLSTSTELVWPAPLRSTGAQTKY